MKTQMTKHTPLPWHANGTQIIGKAGKRHQYIADVCRDVGAESARANAEFIFRACNSHDELLGALRSCFEMLTSPKFSGWIDANCADDELWAMTAAMIQRRDEARAAIAKAEGRGE